MMIIENTLGNERDPTWTERLRDARIDLLHLDQWEAQKSRLRKATEAGVELALSLDRATQLGDGDVLFWDAGGGGAIVARIALNDVMVIDLSGVEGVGHEAVVRTMFELGHALGNQHWPAIVKGGRVYVPLTVDRKVMASVMKTHAFTHIRYDFAPGVEVLPYMTPHEARRLFGGAGQASHAHPVMPTHDRGDGHGHTHGKEHPHHGHDQGQEGEPAPGAHQDAAAR